MMNIPLLKTSEVEAIIVDDSDSEQDESEPSKVEASAVVEPTPKRRRINSRPPKQLIACYHAIGPIAWQRIITNLIDVSKETAEQLDMVPWGATTPLMVILLMARRDALDLVKALPALMQDHPHMKFQLFMLVSTRDSEPTKDACLRRLAEMYLNGACAFPGIKPLGKVPSDWDSNELDNIHNENLAKLLSLGKFETIEIFNGRPCVTETVLKWTRHKEFGLRMQAE